MEATRDRAALRLLLAAVLATLLATGVAVLGGLAPLLADGPTPTGAAIALAVALTTLVALDRHVSRVALRPCRVTPRTAHADAAATPATTLDPVHHPRRPRAPGAR